MNLVEKIQRTWTALEKRFLPPYVWQSDPLTYWRERVLFIMAFFASTLGPIVLIPSLWLAFFEELWSVIALDSLAYAVMLTVLLRNNWSLRTRGILVCLVLYALGIGLSVILGPYGAGYIWLFGASVMISTLIGLGAALWSLVINALTLGGVALIVAYGSLDWALQIDNALQKWIVTSVNFMLLNTFVTTATAFMLDRIKSAFLKERKISHDLRMSQNDLRLHQERFTTVLDSIDATIYVSDMQNHEILFMNKSMVERYGKDYTGEKCWAVLRGANGPCDCCSMAHITDGEGSPTGVHVWQEQNPVTQKWSVNYDRAIKWTDGRLTKIQIATDITELKKMEEELRQAHKMEAIGTLAGGIAHDFNNILSSIIGYTELALDDVKPGTLLEDDLQEVFRAAKRARDLVKQILAFARQSDEKVKPMQVNTIIKEALKLLRSSIPTTIEIRHRISSNSLIEGNPGQVHRIIMNLCTNAAQAMQSHGGIMTVILADVLIDTDAGRPGQTLRPGNYVILTVHDTGSGIEPGIMKSIFEPYFTTKGPGEGTGMGLATVQGIVESYGGQVFVESKKKSGTTFTVYFPRCRGKSEIQASMDEKLPAGNEHILFVDDESAIAKMGRQTMQRLGYRVTTQTSGLAALNLFRSDPMEFDLIITDMTMPHLTGDRLALELIRIRPDIPIILCTGYSNKISEKQAAQIGIKALLYKPLEKKELAVIIRKILDSA